MSLNKVDDYIKTAIIERTRRDFPTIEFDYYDILVKSHTEGYTLTLLFYDKVLALYHEPYKQVVSAIVRNFYDKLKRDLQNKWLPQKETAQKLADRSNKYFANII